jgi:hypothetical protein
MLSKLAANVAAHALSCLACPITYGADRKIEFKSNRSNRFGSSFSHGKRRSGPQAASVNAEGFNLERTYYVPSEATTQEVN